jgi:hypothetical protein
LLQLCHEFAAFFPLVCCKFTASLLQVCRMFVATLIVNPYLCVMCVHVVNIFRVAVLGGPQNQPLIGPNAHLQEYNNDGVRAPDVRPRLIGYSDGFEVLWEDAQCVTGRAQKWISDITEGSVDLVEIRDARCKGDDHPDAAAHVKQFRSIWAVNDGTQGLSPTEQEQSMIVEFQLSLEGQAARWYAQQDIRTFVTFQELVDNFLEMFQVKIDPTEVLKEYYLLQQAGESVADFLLRF